MNSDFGNTRARRFRVVGLIAACLLQARCGDDGPTAPTTPTEVAVPNVAGSWIGTYRECSIDIIGCTQTVSASATFRQNGSRITGAVTTQGSRFSEASLDGSLVGGEIHGTLTFNGAARRVSGPATQERISISFQSSSISSGSIELTR